MGQGYQTVEGTGLNENAYTDALQTVALNHENASEELDDFRQALENGTAE
jgi:phage-related protein